jgi:gliding motility-associated-like protein
MINLDVAGINHYNVTIVDEYGCAFDTMFTIEVVQSPIPNINEGLDTARICAGEIMILNANYEDPDAEYWWNTGATSDEIMALVEGLYFVEVTASTIDGNLICKGWDSIFVSINPHPVPDFDLDKKEGCAPMEIQFTNLTTPADIPLVYQWKVYNLLGQEVFVSNLVNPNFFVEEPSSYHVQLIVSTENGCTDSVMRWNFFVVHPQPIAEFSFTPEISLLSETGGVINFTNYCDSVIFANNPDATWYWDYADGIRESALWNPTHTYATWGDYDVEFNITTAFGCKSSIKHTVVIEEDLQFPNIITPNGDGFNDVFAVKNLNIDINPEDPDQYRANSLQIYDRWGKKVYDEENYDTYMKDDQIYPGSKVFDGNKLQDGQYYFSFNYKGKVKSVKYSGSLLIVRSKE